MKNQTCKRCARVKAGMSWMVSGLRLPARCLTHSRYVASLRMLVANLLTWTSAQVRPGFAADSGRTKEKDLWAEISGQGNTSWLTFLAQLEQFCSVQGWQVEYEHVEDESCAIFYREYSEYSIDSPQRPDHRPQKE